MRWKIMHYFSNLGTFGILGTLWKVMTPPLFEIFPTETWELFEFLMTPPVGNFSKVPSHFIFEGSPLMHNLFFLAIFHVLLQELPDFSETQKLHQIIWRSTLFCRRDISHSQVYFEENIISFREVRYLYIGKRNISVWGKFNFYMRKFYSSTVLLFTNIDMRNNC